MSVKLELSSSEMLADGDYVPAAEQCQLWANSAVVANDDCIASLQIVTPDEMQKMNLEYRGKDAVTNILSFPMTVPEEVGLNLLGDLVVCAGVLASEASQQNKKLDAHWAHMIVHGMLHLQGYDHAQVTEAEAMETLEIKILHTLGYEDPYQETH